MMDCSSVKAGAAHALSPRHDARWRCAWFLPRTRCTGWVTRQTCLFGRSSTRASGAGQKPVAPSISFGAYPTPHESMPQARYWTMQYVIRRWSSVLPWRHRRIFDPGMDNGITQGRQRDGHMASCPPARDYGGGSGGFLDALSGDDGRAGNSQGGRQRDGCGRRGGPLHQCARTGADQYRRRRPDHGLRGEGEAGRYDQRAGALAREGVHRLVHGALRRRYARGPPAHRHARRDGRLAARPRPLRHDDLRGGRRARPHLAAARLPRLSPAGEHVRE